MWEYMDAYAHAEPEEAVVLGDWLNQFGRDRWELVTSFEQKVDRKKRRIWVFKRAIRSSE